MGRLIIQPFGGLCNRLRAVVSASILADQLGREFQVDWVADPATCGCVPRDLFRVFPGIEAAPSSAPFVEIGRLDPRRLATLNAGADIRIRTQNELRLARAEGAPFDDEFARRLQGLEPHPFISRRVPAFMSPTIGLHIRRADHWPSTRYSPLHLFHRAIDAHRSDGVIPSLYLATDSAEVASSMSARYGTRLHQLEERHVERGSVDGMTDALVDLLTLARTRVIYGSVHSSYSVMASRWGGVPLRTLRIPETPTAFSGTLLDRMHHRFLRYDAETRRWQPRLARRWSGRIAGWFLRPLTERLLVRRADRVLSDAYQEGRADANLS